MKKREIIVCMGQSCSGKTTYAKRIALNQPEFEYVPFDAYWNYDLKYEEGSNNFFRSVREKFAKGNVIIDGTNLPKEECEYYSKKLKAEVKLVYLFVQPETLCTRQKAEKKIPRTLNQIFKSYKDHKKLLEGLKVYYVKNTYCKDKYERMEVEQFNTEINRKVSIPNFVKTLSFYHNVKINQQWYGQDPYTPKTYELMKNVSFKRRSVLDLGCYYGTYSFMALEKGATKVVGVDRSLEVLSVAEKIGMLNNYSNYNFLHDNLDNLRNFGLEGFDIVMVLNVLHHATSPKDTLDNCFRIAKKLVVMEVEMPNKERGDRFAHFKYLSKQDIDAIAGSAGFKVQKSLSSSRPFRKFIIYEKGDTK